MKPPILRAYFDQGQVPTIACVDASGALSTANFRRLVNVLQKYADLFARVWGAACKVVAASAIAAGQWGLVFIDSPDVANAAGYHTLTQDGLPLSKVFCRGETLNAICTTASHEIAEMLIDPGVQLAAMGPHSRWYAYEVCDATQADTFKIDGLSVSNFVYPSWFENFRRAGSVKFDYLGLCRRPFEIRRGGYMPVYFGDRWQAVFGNGTSIDRRKKFCKEIAAAWHPRTHRRCAACPVSR